jgi:2-polyprenyl-3-methyl-5-hydroxy-6-metoxy-1,4-benzoquinol methylase
LFSVKIRVHAFYCITQTGYVVIEIHQSDDLFFFIHCRQYAVFTLQDRMRKEEVDKENRIEHSHWWYAGTREICFDLMERIIFTNNSRAPLQILDVGCGTGGNLEVYKKYGNARGIDCDEHSLEYCRKKGLSVETGSMKKLAGSGKRYDVVSFFDVLNQLPVAEQPDVLSQVNTILSDNGHVVLREPALGFFSGRHDREVGIQVRYGRREMRQLLEGAGFAVEFMSYINFFLSIPIGIVRKYGLLFDKSPRSDVAETPAPLNALLLGVLRLEKVLLRRMTFPFGVSLVAIARKQTAAARP